MRLYVLLCLVLVVASGVGAVNQTSSDTTVDTLVDLLHEYRDLGGGYVAAIYGGERFNIVVQDVGKVGVIVSSDSGSLRNITKGGLPRPDHRLVTDASTVRKVAKAENGVEVALRLYRSGAVSLEGVGFWNSIQSSIISWF